MIDYKQLAIDCEEYAVACYRSKLWALSHHERTCRDAILELQKWADNLEYCLGYEQIRAAKAEAEANNLRKAHCYILVDGEELTISQLYDRLVETKARCGRLEEARENANEAASKWEGQCKILEQRMDAIIKLLPKVDIGCELCSNACDTNDRDCVECRVDCKCRYCNSPDGHSNWQFVGWDKVLQEDDHEKSNNCAAWDAAGPQILPDPKRLDIGTAGRSL